MYSKYQVHTIQSRGELFLCPYTVVHEDADIVHSVSVGLFCLEVTKLSGQHFFVNLKPRAIDCEFRQLLHNLTQQDGFLVVETTDLNLIGNG